MPDAVRRQKGSLVCQEEFLEVPVTDTIGIALQQAMEKSLKALLANDNRKIKKTHDLIEIYKLTIDSIQFEEYEIDFLDVATNYYSHDKYPVMHSSLPQR